VIRDRADREAARAVFAQQGLPFFEVYVKVDLAEAEKRDPKGLYKKARAGAIKGQRTNAPRRAPSRLLSAA